MILRLNGPLTGAAVVGFLFVVAQGCGGGFEASKSSDGGGLDGSTEGDSSTPDTGSSSDAGAPGSGDDAGSDGGDGGACPAPQPMPCGLILECPCVDGTTQRGGCPNGFMCAEACCGHGGST